LQGDIAFEPALAAARPDQAGNQHRDDNEHEGASDFMDAPKFEALSRRLPLVVRGQRFKEFSGWVHGQR
jgi:hypothetical protein